MNDIKIFKNQEFGEIRVQVINQEPLFMLSDVCRVLEIKNSRDAKSRLKKDGVVTTDIIDSIGRKQGATFINESNLYKLIFQSRKEEAERFQGWVCDEVLPSIRKNGAYMTDNVLEKAIQDPDFMIGLLNNLKEEKAKRLEAEKRVELQGQIIQHKTEVIEGLVEDIPLADLRQRINQIVRKGGVSEINKWWHLLYDEFNRKYHINIYARMNNCEYSGSRLDYVEKELHMIPELYDLTCKLFENSYKDLMKSWGKTAKRAARYRNN